MFHKKIAKCLLGYWPISERNIMCKIQAKPFNLVILQCYAPTADQSNDEIEKFYSEIELALKQTKSDDVVFIIGDLNAKIGNIVSENVGKYGLGMSNEHGEILVEFCEKNNFTVMNTFFKHPKRRLYTWKSPGDVVRNQIDYILVKSRFKNCVRKCRTYPGADIGSDHNPVMATVNIKLKIPNVTKSQPKLDVSALKSPQIREEFAVKVENRFNSLFEEGEEQVPGNHERIDHKWECLKTAINEVQEAILPKRNCKAKQVWMTDDILDLMTERKSKKGTDAYKILDEKIKKKCKEAKQEWANNKCAKIEQLANKNQTKRMFDEIKQFHGKRFSSSGCIKDKNGDVLFEVDKIIDRWKEYIEDLFYDNRADNPIQDYLQGPKIVKSEIESALKQMSKGKAVGVDNISAEALQALGDFGIEKLTELCNDMYKSAYIPEDLRTSIFIALPKKPGATECSDHRTISLMCHVLKLLLIIILRRISDKINKNVGPEQAGFRKESGTREGIFNLRMLIEKYLEKQKDVFACFIDYSKAFDTVKHHELIKSLQSTDIDENDIAVISNLYWQQKTTVRINNSFSNSLNIKRGVRQGCVLSPALFNLYTDIIFRQIEELPGLKMGGLKINNLRYSDDTVLLAENEKDLQEIAEKVKVESEKFGLLMNVKKTKTMVFTKSLDIPKISITIDGKIIEQVSSFAYLGALVTEDGRCEKELVRRIAIAKRNFASKYNMLTNHDLSLKMKLRLTQCYIWSTLLYGCETWSLTPTLEKKLRSFEMWTYRRLGRISWKEKKTNKAVLNMFGLKSTSLMSTVRKRIARYYGHIRRHNSIQKSLVEGMVEGTRGRGRKRTNWVDNVTRYAGMGINDCARKAMDRKGWRIVVSNVVADTEQW